MTTEHKEKKPEKTAEQKKEAMQSFISGGIAGVVAKSAIAPFERVKLIFMTSKEKFTYAAAFKKLAELYETEGFLALWRGNLMTCIRIFFYASIVIVCNNSQQFGVYDWLRIYFNSKSPTDTFISGALSGICANISVYPFELLRTRMAMQGHLSTLSLKEIIIGTRKKEGYIAGFYKGSMASLLGIVIYKGVGFSIYEYLKRHNYDRLENSKFFLNFSSGMIAAFIGQMVSYPIEVAKRRMQVSGTFDSGNPEKHVSKSSGYDKAS